jgi:hypothetical protein
MVHERKQFRFAKNDTVESIEMNEIAILIGITDG